MFFTRFHKRKAQATIEMAAFTVLVLISFVVFQKYITRVFNGRMKVVGDALGQGKIYDPALTIECVHGYPYVADKWYDLRCFEAAGGDCLTTNASSGSCQSVINACATAECN